MKNSFLCHKFNCQISYSSCVARQTMTKPAGGSRFPECTDCEQGKEIKLLSLGIPTKACPKCRKVFPATTEYFVQNRTKRDGLGTYCRSCSRTYKREWARNRTEKLRQFQSRIFLDLDLVPGLDEALRKSAERNLRTPAKEALAILSKTLLKERR